MLAKLTSRNRLTLPKRATNALGAVGYFEVKVQGGQIILTPVRIRRADSVRAKLARRHLVENDVVDAVVELIRGVSAVQFLRIIWHGRMARPSRRPTFTNHAAQNLLQAPLFPPHAAVGALVD